MWDVGTESRIPLISLLKSGEVVGPEHKPGDAVDGMLHRQRKQFPGESRAAYYMV